MAKPAAKKKPEDAEVRKHKSLMKAVTPGQRDSAAMPMGSREAPIENVDAKERTFDVVWTAGARVRRYDWYRDRWYWEELSMDPAHVRMGRLKSGRAPVLDSHWGYRLEHVLGVVQNATLGKEGRCSIKLSQREGVADVITDVRDGIIANVSVGYNFYRIEMVEPKKEDELWVYRVVDWEPLEVSLVPMPADEAAGIRNVEDDERFKRCEFIDPSHRKNKNARAVDGVWKFAIGDRVEALADHMDGLKGMTGKIAIAKDGPYYAIEFDEPMDGMAQPHKWLAESELQAVTSDGDEMEMDRKNPPATAGSTKEADMAFLVTLARALGIKTPDGAEESVVRSALTTHLQLKGDASDDDIAGAVARRGEPAALAPANQVTAERGRVAEIGEFCTKHRAEAEFRDKAIKDGWSLDRTGKELLLLRAEKGDTTGPSPIPPSTGAPSRGGEVKHRSANEIFHDRAKAVQAFGRPN